MSDEPHVKDGVNVSFKAGAIITGLAIIFVAAFGWLLKGKFESYDRQIKRQWTMGGKRHEAMKERQWEIRLRNEKIICKYHPDDCF
jgi:hypothetical protein